MFAKKSLGQHFLNSPHVLGQIISSSNIKPGETVLEIGPGTGVLTEALLKAGACVIAVEKDDRALSLLAEKFSREISEERLEIIPGDILDKNIFTKKDSGIPTSFSLVANIPYYITGAILERFLEQGPRPERMVLLVQREVAERIVARDGKESILSISVKAFGVPQIIARVPPGAFTPPPSVESAILSIKGISDRAFSSSNLNIRSFFEVVKAGFAHKRKFAKSNIKTLKKNDPQTLDAAWKKANLDEKVRAEDILLEQWFALSTELQKSA